jgi:L-alanine-DL-glutamate epimerase-like enolase superfamily enzyme
MKTVVRELHPRRAFRISRARRNAVRNVFVRLEADGVCGHGEASPNAFYDETAEGVLARLAEAEPWLRDLKIRSVADLETAWDEAWRLVAPSRGAQCAIDLALWDWLAKRGGVSAVELAWGHAPKPVATFCTIGLSERAELEEKVAELVGFPFIKIKSDQLASTETVRFVRDRSGAVLAVDANCAWSGVDLPALSAELARLEVAFIEQPLPPERDALLTRLSSCLPVLADESCVVETDVPRVAAHFAGFNIKLVKCGGVTPGLRMARRGRELGLQTMVGCMLESSTLIAAGAVVAQATNFADLDGAWLLSDDPVRGWSFDRGMLLPSAAPGLGIEPEAALFADA